MCTGFGPPRKRRHTRATPPLAPDITAVPRDEIIATLLLLTDVPNDILEYPDWMRTLEQNVTLVVESHIRTTVIPSLRGKRIGLYLHGLVREITDLYFSIESHQRPSGFLITHLATGQAAIFDSTAIVCQSRTWAGKYVHPVKGAIDVYAGD